jgi:high-affinity iron transporter
MRGVRRTRGLRAFKATPAALFAVLAVAATASAQSQDAQDTQPPPWKAAEAVRQALFEPQTDLVLGETANPEAVAEARRAFGGSLADGLRRDDPAALRDAVADLDRAEHAVETGDEAELASARGDIVAAIRRGAYAVTLAAVRDGDVETARDWILVRDFRQATRFTRPGVDATAAIDSLQAGEIEPRDAALAVKKDLLDAYQTRLKDFIDEADNEAKRDYGPALAESAAIVNGYWQILAPEYARQRSPSEREAADTAFAQLRSSALAGDRAGYREARDEVLERIDGFTAAPFTPEEQARRAAQLTRFVELLPTEWDHGTEDGEVTIPFELQEMLAFIDGAEEALDDLKGPLEEKDPAAVASVEAALVELRGYANDANEGGEVVSQEQVDATQQEATDTLDSIFPEEWKESSDEADFDLVEISLDQMEAAVSASEYDQAETARLSAYAFFEFGPEIKLQAFDPQLVAEVEGLVWYGARGVDGLGELIASGADARELRETRLVLDEALDEARAKTGEGASDTTVVVNAATIVFREGLEAILIIAAITASMVGGNRRLRKPVYKGALLALPASIGLFLLSLFVLDTLSQYGEKLEAVVGLIAIGVLLLVMNWFFHRVYWTEWISGHRKRGLKLAAAGVGAGAATVVGLYLLGFSSVLREGFETVLFLQALQLSSGTGIVVAGVALGLLAVAAVGAVTFKLEQKLPYKKMLIVTGVMIALVLVVMVGNTVRTMQGVGWLPITPLDVEFPLWMGTWLGVFPTVESLAAQGAAFAFVIGSYYAAGWYRKRRSRPVAAAPTPAAEAPAGNGNGHGRLPDGPLPAPTRVSLEREREPAGSTRQGPDSA